MLFLSFLIIHFSKRLDCGLPGGFENILHFREETASLQKSIAEDEVEFESMQKKLEAVEDDLQVLESEVEEAQVYIIVRVGGHV